MRYLRNSDYRYKITEYDLTTLVEDEVNPDLFIFDAEIKAQEQISMFLRKRYDLEQLFKTYDNYKSGITYTSGATVWYGVDSSYDIFLYSPLPIGTADTFDNTFDDTFGDEPTLGNPTGTGWKRVEPRFPSILDWMVTISIYKLHERVAPDNIPSHRKDSYDEVMRMLKMIQEGKLSPSFPEVENRLQNIYIGGQETNGIGFNY